VFCTRRAQLRLAILADRLEQPEPHLSGAFLANDDRLVHEAGHRVQDRLRRQICVAADRLGSLEVETVSEDGGTRPQGLLRQGAQLVAPVDGRLEGTMARRGGPAALGQQLESVVQPGRQVGHRKHRKSRRCELDGQRNAFQALAEPDHRRLVVRSDREFPHDGRRPLRE
jgi:hypothetical protein